MKALLPAVLFAAAAFALLHVAASETSSAADASAFLSAREAQPLFLQNPDGSETLAGKLLTLATGSES